jgi:hypothetical protein
VDSNGKYLDHATISDKRSITQHGKLMDVLGKYDSKETLEILKTDGENANRCGIFGFSPSVFRISSVSFESYFPRTSINFPCCVIDLLSEIVA